MEELKIEKVTNVISSIDKKEIFLGTSFGRIVVMSSKNFENEVIFKNRFESPIKDFAVKDTTLMVGHENGQIDLFEKQNGD